MGATAIGFFLSTDFLFSLSLPIPRLSRHEGRVCSAAAICERKGTRTEAEEVEQRCFGGSARGGMGLEVLVIGKGFSWVLCCGSSDWNMIRTRYVNVLDPNWKPGSDTDIISASNWKFSITCNMKRKILSLTKTSTEKKQLINLLAMPKDGKLV